MGSWADTIRQAWRDDPRQFTIRAGIGLVAVLVLVFIWQAWTAALALNEAKGDADALTRAIARGEVPRARTLLIEFDDATTRAHHRTDGPLWKLGAALPIVGRNFNAVSTVAAEADAIADDALPKIVNVADQVRLDTFRPQHGRVNLAAVAKTMPVLEATNRVMAHADRKVGAIRADGLVAPMQGPFADLQIRTHRTAVAISTAYEAGKLLPTMLGGGGKERHYLLMVLNNSEVRSLVGMPGSFAILDAKNGKLSMGRQGSIEDILPLHKEVSKVPAEVDAGFDSRIGSDIRETMILPDYPRAAQLAAAIEKVRWEVPIDGVISVDPVALGYVLGAVGGIDIGGGLTVNQYTAAATLLNGIYLRYPGDNEKQNAAFENAARRTFNALTSGRGNSVLAIQALVRGVQERRIYVWSRHPSEQKRILSGGIAGTFTDEHQLKRPQIGVYVTDDGSAKMSYYLRMGTRVRATGCYLRGIQDLTVTTTVSSDAPQTGRRLPRTITGPGILVPVGGLAINVRVVGPPGGQIVSQTVDGQQAPINAGRYQDRQITKVKRVLFAAESSVIITKIRTAANTTGDPLLRTTPGVLPNEDDPGTSACN